ncbi:MAG: enoyl-CoA hydratase family protein [Rhodobacteraceae bacterium]|nr:enoyl-CoA hydratase family protein [Paracoccaceae bacterium]
MSVKVRHEIEAGCLTIWNCNAARRNALSPEYYQGLVAGLAKANESPDIAAVILAGEGGFFCAGGDLNSLRERRDLSETERRAQIDKLNAVIRAIRHCRKPVIAAVEGGAAGAGLSIAMACDMVVASDVAMFTLAYVRAGLVPDGAATYALMQALPRPTVARMALLGAPIAATRLYEMGAVTEIVAEGAAYGAAQALAAEIAAGPEEAMASIKALLNEAETATHEEQLAAERTALARALGGEEAQIGMTAFLNKKPPVFR